MWVTEATCITTAAKEQVWKLWEDVSNWNVWDKEVEFSEVFGPFQAGTEGLLKPAGGPKTKFIIIECTPHKSFTDRSFLPLCKIDFIHTMKETANGLEVTHKVVITGCTTFLFSKIMGKKIEAGLLIAVKKLTEIAEKD